jgi:hypothetical protein
MRLSRRYFMLFTAVLLGTGAWSVARRSLPQEPLATDPDAAEFVYRDRWVVRVR